MKQNWLGAAALALALAAPGAAAQDASAMLAEAKLEGFAQTQAVAIDDYQGRAILLEFFAYW